MNLLPTILAANNHGIACMVEKDFSAAIAMFRKSLELLHNFMALNHTNVTPPPETFSRPSSGTSMETSLTCLGDSMDTNGCAVFDRCFYMLPGETRPQEGRVPLQQDEEKQLLIAMLLFNTALATHLQGLRSGVQRFALFAKAQRIYKMATEILQNQDLSNDDDSANLLLAISNNLACLALEMQNFDAFEVFREWMKILILDDSRGDFYHDFFSTNYVAACCVRARHAPAA